MATGGRFLEEHLKCTVHLDIFNDPRNLPCGHTFCKSCLERVSANERCIKCPECRKSYPKMPISDLPVNYRLAQLAEELLLRSGKECVCENHGRSMDMYCTTNNCTKLICTDCLYEHKGHVIISAKEECQNIKIKLNPLADKVGDELETLHVSIDQGKELLRLLQVNEKSVISKLDECEYFNRIIEQMRTKLKHQALEYYRETSTNVDKDLKMVEPLFLRGTRALEDYRKLKDDDSSLLILKCKEIEAELSPIANHESKFNFLTDPTCEHTCVKVCLPYLDDALEKIHFHWSSNDEVCEDCKLQVNTLIKEEEKLEKRITFLSEENSRLTQKVKTLQKENDELLRQFSLETTSVAERRNPSQHGFATQNDEQSWKKVDDDQTSTRTDSSYGSTPPTQRLAANKIQFQTKQALMNDQDKANFNRFCLWYAKYDETTVRKYFGSDFDRYYELYIVKQFADQSFA